MLIVSVIVTVCLRRKHNALLRGNKSATCECDLLSITV